MLIVSCYQYHNLLLAYYASQATKWPIYIPVLHLFYAALADVHYKIEHH